MYGKSIGHAEPRDGKIVVKLLENGSFTYVFGECAGVHVGKEGEGRRASKDIDNRDDVTHEELTERE